MFPILRMLVYRSYCLKQLQIANLDKGGSMRYYSLQRRLLLDKFTSTAAKSSTSIYANISLTNTNAIHTRPPSARRPELNPKETASTKTLQQPLKKEHQRGQHQPALQTGLHSALPLYSHQRDQQKQLQQQMEHVKIPYNIDWIFTTLKNPSKLWYIASQIAVTIVGLFSKFVLFFMNRTRVYNIERLERAVAHRPHGMPLVTVSNHHSCFDDPGLWGVLPIRYVCNTLRIRWSMAAHDICFTNKYHSLFFMFGKCIPVVRGLGVYQDAINLCIQKCASGEWVHVFPEGKVNMTKEEMRLKWGVGRIIYESPRIPIILPMWHEGMDEVLPNVEPYILKWRKKVTLNIGEPLDLYDFIKDLKDRKVPEPEARKLITDKIQAAFREIRYETEELHRKRS